MTLLESMRLPAESGRRDNLIWVRIHWSIPRTNGRRHYTYGMQCHMKSTLLYGLACYASCLSQQTKQAKVFCGAPPYKAQK